MEQCVKEKKPKSIQKYDRHSIVNIEIILEEIKENSKKVYQERTKVEINSVKINIESLRLRTFAEKGTVCKCCGLEATHFAIERDMATAAKDGGYHLNLWGVKDGEEVLFTHDHVLARGLGGKDNLDNTQTMCCYCNWEKGDLEAILANELKEKK